MNESDRLLGAIPPETSVKICATSRFQLGGVEDLRGNSFAVEHALQVQGGLKLVAGRVCGIDAQVVGKDLHGLVTQTIPVDRRRLLCTERDEGKYAQCEQCTTKRGERSRHREGTSGWRGMCEQQVIERTARRSAISDDVQHDYQYHRGGDQERETIAPLFRTRQPANDDSNQQDERDATEPRSELRKERDPDDGPVRDGPALLSSPVARKSA